MEPQSKNDEGYDIAGIFISAFCGLHCLITPLLIISAPALGKSLQSPWVHTTMIAFMLFAFYQSVYKKYKLHKSKLPLGLGLVGVIFILGTYINEIIPKEEHGHPEGAHGDETVVVIFAITGALLIIVAHIINLRKCRCLPINK